MFENSCNDLSLDKKTRDHLAAIICAGYIEGYSCYITADIFNEACNKINYPSDMFKYLVDKEDVSELAFLYVNTCTFRSINKFYLIRAKSDPGIVGTEISACGDDFTCSKCKKMDGKRFSINKVPTIPFHWGCRCTYFDIFKGERI